MMFDSAFSMSDLKKKKSIENVSSRCELEECKEKWKDGGEI